MCLDSHNHKGKPAGSHRHHGGGFRPHYPWRRGHRRFVGVVAQWVADNGITYQSRNMCTTDCLEIQGGEAFTLKLGGDPAERI